MKTAMEKRWSQFLAIFMSLLIITLPFYTADAFAVVTFGDVTATGADGVAGFRKAVDETRIKAVINSPSSQILPTFLEVINDTRGVSRNAPDVRRFSQCSTTNPYECTVTLPLSAVDDKDKYLLCINLANVEGRRDFPQSCAAARSAAMENGNQYSSFPSVLVDKQGPTVQRFVAEPSGVSSGMINLTATVLDSTGTPQRGCVGLKKITFYKTDGTSLGENTTSAPSVFDAPCQASVTQFHFSSDPLSNGASTKICAVPEDAFGNVLSSYRNREGAITPTPQNCINITKDNRPPTIENFTLKDVAGVNELAFVPNHNVDVQVSAMVTTHTHAIGTVNASVASLRGGVENVDLHCTEKIPDPRDEESTDHLYECTTTTNLNPDGDKTRTIGLKTVDAANNRAEASKTLTFQIDDVPPAVQQITSERVFNGASVLGPTNNTLVVTIAETGAGISNKTILINNQMPESCDQTEAGAYVCKKTAAPGSVATLSVAVRGKDLAGNDMESLTNKLPVDATPPEFVRAQIVSSSSSPVPVAGSGAILRLIVKENLAMSDDTGATRALAQIPFDADNPTVTRKADHCQPYVPPQTPIPSTPPPTPPPSSPDASLPPGAEPAAGGLTFDPGTGALVAVTGNPVQQDPNENLWQCDWEIPNLKLTNNLVVTFSKSLDLAGNTLVKGSSTAVETSELFMVYTDSLGRTREIAPQDWLGKIAQEGLAPVRYLIQSTMTSPIVDGRGAAVAPIGIWFTLHLTPEQLPEGQDIKPVSVDVTQCSGADYEAGFFAQEATKVMFSITNSKVALMRFNLRPGKIPEDKTKFVVTCEFAIMSQSGGHVSGITKTPVTFEIPVGNVKDVSDSIWDTIVQHTGGFGDLPGSNWYSGISSINKLMEYVDKLDKVVSVMLSICNLANALAALSTALHVLTSTLGVAFEGKAFLDPISRAITALYNGVDTVTEFFFDGLYGEVICNVLTCQLTPTGALLRSIGFKEPALDIDALLDDKMDDVKSDLSTNAELSIKDPRKRTALLQTAWGNPKSSLWLSYLTLCVPGILENLKKREAVECKYVSCLYNNVAQGMPKTTCEKVYNYETCKIETNEIAALIPFLHIHRQIAGAIKQLLTQPVTLFILAGAYTCKYTSSASASATASGLCGVLYVPFRLLKVVNDVKVIWDTIENFGESPDDACEDIIKQVKADPRYGETVERHRSGTGGTIPTREQPAQSSAPSLPPSTEEVSISD